MRPEPALKPRRGPRAGVRGASHRQGALASLLANAATLTRTTRTLHEH